VGRESEDDVAVVVESRVTEDHPFALADMDDLSFTVTAEPHPGAAGAGVGVGHVLHPERDLGVLVDVGGDVAERRPRREVVPRVVDEQVRPRLELHLAVRGFRCGHIRRGDPWAHYPCGTQWDGGDQYRQRSASLEQHRRTSRTDSAGKCAIYCHYCQ